MADIKSELPIRSQLPGQVNYDDVIVKIGDGTNPATQLLGIDSSGRVVVKLDDGAGNLITSQASGAQRALDVGINVAGVQIDPRQIRALTSADIVTAAQGAASNVAGSWFTQITDGTHGPVAVKAASTAAIATDPSFVVALSPNTPLPAGTNLLGSINQGTSPWVSKDQSDGPVTPGTAAAFSMLVGAQFNSVLPTLTTGQQSAIQSDASGRVIIAPLTSASIVTVSNLPTTVDTNYGTVGASTIRTASQLGNATGAANFGNGATGAQTLRVAANLAVAGADVSGTNPIPVSITSALVGTSVNNYNTAAALAAAASSNHIYTITTGKTFNGKKIHASASGRMKVEVRTSPDGTTYSSIFVAFNSTANPNIDIDMDELVFLSSGTGSTIEIIRTNIDLLAQDVYSTISGTEV